MAEALTILSSAGVQLEAELADAGATPRAAVVLCHPHPQYGGTMQSIVISALFAALPSAGFTTLRFNFRGVGGSTGAYDHGRGERDDARAAVHALADRAPGGTPLVLAGWSFGADVALSVLDPELRAWIAVAPPFHFVADADAVGADPRPKLLVLAAHDEVRASDEIEAIASTWTATSVVVVPGASHFFVGRTDRLTADVLEFLDHLLGG